MTTGGILFLMLFGVAMALFSAVLAWGVHVTKKKD